MLKKRSSGILLPIFSLPSPYGIGDFGPYAFRFADFLSKAGQRFWQVLPLNPTNYKTGNSPYSSISSFAGNTLLISPEILFEQGFINRESLKPSYSFPRHKVSYQKAFYFKQNIFEKSYEKFKRDKKYKEEYEKFCFENDYWLSDFALFLTLKRYFKGKSWNEWSKEIKDRNLESLKLMQKKLHDKIEKEKFLQFIFYKQWNSLKNYCAQKGIYIIGDLPFYVDYDSADVWTNPSFFELDKNKEPLFVAGVPPDYFSETGQRWGNPVYNWNKLREDGYSLWIQRIKHNSKLFTLLRIDHFRGFAGFWCIPVNEKNAIKGEWRKGPGKKFFDVLIKEIPSPYIIAEDLGFITQDVKKLISHFNFPGMRVLLFAFNEEDDKNPNIPYNHPENCVVYTGTHDNNTVRGWFEEEATSEMKKRLFKYLGEKVSAREIHWKFIEMAMNSPAKLCIIPMQDILGLGSSARLNKPSIKEGNWQWRLLPEYLTEELSQSILKLTKLHKRE